MNKKNFKWIATTTGELGQPMHNGDDIPILYDSADAAFFAGQDMQGVSMWNDAFVVRPLNESDIDLDTDAEKYAGINFPNPADHEDYPVYVGYNGACWVREWYQKILFEILSEKPDWKRIADFVGYLPPLDPDRVVLQQLLEAYKTK